MRRSANRPAARPYKNTALILAPILSLGIAFSSVAAYDPKTEDVFSVFSGDTPLDSTTSISFLGGSAAALGLEENNELIVIEQAKLAAEIKKESDTCADPDAPKSLAQVQAETIQEAYKVDTTGVDLDKPFRVTGGGCIPALNSFPDLSLQIPSLTSIVSNMAGALTKYAVRKACKVTNDAIGEALSPIRNNIQKLSDGGQLDLNGNLNKKVTGKMYEIDPDLGRLTKPTDPLEQVDIFAGSAPQNGP